MSVISLPTAQVTGVAAEYYCKTEHKWFSYIEEDLPPDLSQDLLYLVGVGILYDNGWCPGNPVRVWTSTNGQEYNSLIAGEEYRDFGNEE